MANFAVFRVKNGEDHKLDQLRIEFDEEKCQLYELLLVYRFLQELTTSSRLPNETRDYLNDVLCCQQANRFDRKTLDSFFTFGDEDETLFSPILQKPSNFKSILRKVMTERLNSLKQTASSVLSGTSSGFSNWSEIPDFVENVSSKEQQVMNLRNEFFNLLSEYEKVFTDFIETAKKYVDKILLDQQTKYYNETIKWLIGKAEPLHLKAKVTELELLTKIYTAERNAILLQFKVKTEVKIKEITSKILETQSLLKSYSNVAGPTFEKLVSEYEKLEKEIENKIWALNEFDEMRK